jgi:hypothetical protein
MELGERRRQQHSKEEEYVMRIVNNAIRKARELARSKGPLIYVKIDKAYYEANSP